MITTLLSLLLTLVPLSVPVFDPPQPAWTFGRDPALVSLAKPEYPDIAFGIRLEGMVIVAVQIDESGKPLSARILRSSSILFEEAALNSAMNSTFSPALGVGGRPIATVVHLPFAFRIR